MIADKDRILPDQVAPDWPAERQLPALGDRPQAHALDAIAARYGARTAGFVATRLEYPARAPPPM